MMIDGVRAAPAPGDEEARLRQAARDLEGVFLNELLKAMRETIPGEGLIDGGAGEELFTGMLDQHLAPQLGGAGERGIAAALYHQLRGAMGAPGPASG